MSCKRAPTFRRLALDRLSWRSLRVWPAACIPLLASACYFGKIEQYVNDEAPVILGWSNPPSSTILLDAQAKKIYVAVADENVDTLRYEWFISDNGRLEDARSIPNGGTEVTITPQESYDGQRLTLTVADELNQTTELFWELEVVR